jgi:hypothetical protein
MQQVGRMQAWSLSNSAWRRKDMHITFLDFMADAPDYMNTSMDEFHTFIQNTPHVRALFGEQLVVKALLLKVSVYGYMV